MNELKFRFQVLLIKYIPIFASASKHRFCMHCVPFISFAGVGRTELEKTMLGRLIWNMETFSTK